MDTISTTLRPYVLTSAHPELYTTALTTADVALPKKDNTPSSIYSSNALHQFKIRKMTLFNVDSAPKTREATNLAESTLAGAGSFTEEPTKTLSLWMTLSQFQTVVTGSTVSANSSLLKDLSQVFHQAIPPGSNPTRHREVCTVMDQ